MRLDAYVLALSPLLLSAENPTPGLEISFVANDSRRVVPGTLFCAVPGTRFDGAQFLPEALRSGAVALVIPEHLPSDAVAFLPPHVPVFRVSDSYFAWAILCQMFFQNPAADLSILAVTGTNGKTSTAFILRSLLAAAGKKTGLLSTVGNDLDASGTLTPATHTMPDAFSLQAAFREAADQHLSHLVMEASSHGIHQHRAGAIAFSGAIFTNLSGDHLDYHGSIEHYFQAKKALFTTMTAPNAPIVICRDSEGSERLFRELKQETSLRLLDVSFSDPNAFCFLRSIHPEPNGTRIEFTLDNHLGAIHSPLSGRHNAANLFCAISLAFVLGTPLEKLLHAIPFVPPAPGRLERFLLPSGATVFVDYAHTDDALARVLDTLHSFKTSPSARVICLFGCGGDRDKSKRPRMARAAAERADRLVLTSDNPRSEDPLVILDEIKAGLPDAFSECTVIPDRAQAIAFVLESASRDDLVLLAGKGHENYQEISGEKRHFDDRELVRDFIFTHQQTTGLHA